MQRHDLSFKQEIVKKLVKGKLDRKEACHLLGCSSKTITRYLDKAAKGGLGALKDGRHSNYSKLTPKQLLGVIKEKKE
ncbi:hypothetical protein A3C26_04495 [Candidatus Daviesbacteria bacterium RIFCSPHIGHO2_02_FULL_39_12]|uniref:Uncharacterized protein n=1 Tax=Candidatus Daviesbacteria bacterium RIFCSPHIGHO2_02_FULL_39_12 TaxID=1797770 RepID=A0A1F5J983_9BACT|nr:MAG: hypothetical protein A3C26_04495 [Candidatus Daviesbacteria bacterium RIFCSPHIGHO2_02_FULL_39_12]